MARNLGFLVMAALLIGLAVTRQTDVETASSNRTLTETNCVMSSGSGLTACEPTISKALGKVHVNNANDRIPDVNRGDLIHTKQRLDYTSSSKSSPPDESMDGADTVHEPDLIGEFSDPEAVPAANTNRIEMIGEYSDPEADPVVYNGKVEIIGDASNPMLRR